MFSKMFAFLLFQHPYIIVVMSESTLSTKELKFLLIMNEMRKLIKFSKKYYPSKVDLQTIQ